MDNVKKYRDDIVNKNQQDIKKIVEQVTGFKVLPEDILNDNPVYTLVKQYSDIIVRHECGQGNYASRIMFCFLIDEHINGLSLEVQGTRVACLTTGTINLIPWLVYRLSENECFFRDYNSILSSESVMNEMISYTILMILLHEFGHVFQGHIQNLNQGMQNSKSIMNTRLEHLQSGVSDEIRVLEYAADVYVAKYMSQMFLETCSDRKILFERMRNMYGSTIFLHMILAVFNKEEGEDTICLSTASKISEIFTRVLAETLKFDIDMDAIEKMIREVYSVIAIAIYKTTKMKSGDLVNYQNNTLIKENEKMEEHWNEIKVDVLKFSIWEV